MSKKYLDETGLTYLWSKLKAYFQVKLVSGTNIKTINNTSLLGSGNITISGKSETLNTFYPIGSYYETSDTTFNPNTAWGGTWVLETEGQVHVSAGTNYTVGGALTNTTDGGSKDAVVVSHYHRVSAGWSSSTGTDRITYGQVSGGYYDSGQGNTQFIQDTGVSGTDKNMPPYIVVNRWHRTA